MWRTFIITFFAGYTTGAGFFYIERNVGGVIQILMFLGCTIVIGLFYWMLRPLRNDEKGKLILLFFLIYSPSTIWWLTTIIIITTGNVSDGNGASLEPM